MRLQKTEKEQTDEISLIQFQTCAEWISMSEQLVERNWHLDGEILLAFYKHRFKDFMNGVLDPTNF